MGGVKNRDAKRAANKVFSSGGGGGTKGPAVIDKRNQELQCPHCERVFKQNDRLKQHIQKQHADALAAESGADSDASASTATTSTAPAAASSSKGKAAAVAAPAPAAAAPAPKPAPRMMDIGSKAGAYDHKSPKLLLHELLLREKAPKARYKTLPGPSGGTWLAKVVLPHPKQSDKDVVVFLPESHAAGGEDEACQRGAVAALHRVAGDRALDRTLPPQYVPLWRALGQAAEERSAKEKAAAERRAAQQAKAAAALKKRGPATVIMAEDKRKLVEDIIAEVRGGGGGGGDGDGSSDADGWENFGRPEASAAGSRTVEAAPALTDDLVTLGFSPEDATRAVAAVAPRGAELSAALDWLCLNVPEGRLPSNFAPGAAGKPISVLLKAGQASSASLASTATAAAEEERSAFGGEGTEDLAQDPAVAEITRFGYPPALAAEALRASGGHVLGALRRLYRRLVTGDPAAAEGAEGAENGGGDAADDAESALEEWEEERVALEAIYGGDVAFPSPAWTILKLPVVLDGAAAAAAAAYCDRSKEDLMVDGVGVELEVWAPRGGVAYPAAAPTLGVRCRDLPPRALLALTRALGRAAEAEMLGRPMVYEIAAAVGDALPQALTEAPPLSELLGGGSRPASAAAESVETESDVEEALEETLRLEDGAAGAGRGRRARAPRRRDGPPGGLSPKEIEAQSFTLLAHQRELAASPKHAAMRSQRARLPAAAKRGEVVTALGAPDARVVVISGATGCGKSTQVPQYILEEAISAGLGAACNVIVTQPRRISAVGLASRVAAERGESVGQSVGYSVRLDSKQSRRTRLLFCTTGILLRRLLSDPALRGTTHVVLDEVHERSIESDLLLLLLRRLLASGANPGLRVVLMSATADAELFAGYFDQVLAGSGPKSGKKAQILSIPGFTHPVTDLFLEDALEATGFAVGKSSKWAKRDASKKGAGGGRDDDDDDSGAGAASGNYGPDTLQSLRNIDESLVNYDLIESLVSHVAAKTFSSSKASNTGGGKRGGDDSASAILVFAPGADEIGRIVRALQGSPRLAATASGGLRALPLHGGLPPAHQARVFERPPPGVLKIVVSTNVAETSITIDDVVCVIDCGRVKEMRFDPGRGIARLQETWVSQASAQQRRGRAGRVRPGTCYRLFSRATWGRMPKDTAPEVARAPLQSLVMDIKGILRDIDAAQALAEMVTPPDAAAVAQAVSSLTRVGALDPGDGALTPLGHHLIRMPCDPRMGKMLIYGAMLRCLDPILTVAAAQGHGRPVFWSPPDRRQEADAARRALTAGVAASKSDHLAAVSAFNGWRAALAAGGRGAASAYCTRHYVSEQAMEAVHAGRRQYAEILADLGFVSSDYPSDAAQPSYNPGTVALTAQAAAAAPVAAAAAKPASPAVAWHTAPGGVDQFAGHARIVKAVLAAGLYPQLLRADHPAAKYQKVLGGAMEAAGEAGKVRFFDRDRGRVFLHPSSLNFSTRKFESGWLVYSDVVQTSKVFVRETSMVPVYAVLLFGGEVAVHHGEGLVRVDGWATFKAPARIAVLVRELRAEVGALLARKVADPGVDLGGSRVVEAMHHLLSTDGF